MTDNISESLCKNTQRKQEPCKSLFLENLNNALGKSQVVHHLSPNNTAACPTLSSVMEMNGTALSNSPDAQKTLFIKAEMLRSDMDALCDRLAGHDNCVSLLKRKNMQDFIHGVIEKCNRKTYTQIKQMPDMARGRFNLDSMEQVENVVQALQEIGKEFGLHVKEVVPPRGQFVDVETKLPIPGMFSYPRYHVVLENDDGFQFEWQVGTKSATDILETNGIPILAGLQLPHGINNNLHDIGYDVFRSILTEAKSNREHAEVVSQVGLQEYVSQVDYTLAKAGLLGAKYTELHEDLKKLQHNAGQILEKIMRFKGPNFILKLFH